MSARVVTGGSAVVALAAALLAAPPGALAQSDGEAAPTAEAERNAQARALFEEGLELVEQEQYAEAAERFRRAHALRPASGIAFNLALALIELGELLEASEFLREVGRDASASEQLQGRAEARLEAVRSRLGRLTVQVRGPVEGVRVVKDGDELPEALYGSDIPVDPGLHALEALRDETVVDRTEAHVPEGGSAEAVLTVPVRALEPDPPQVLQDAGSSDATLLEQWWFWTAVGVVAVGAIATTVVLTAGGGSPDPVEGNADPAVLRWP